MSLTIPREYPFVLAAATSTFFVNLYHAILTSQVRRASGIKYPHAYASQDLAEKDPKAFAFNCAQRAHANFIENLPTHLTVLLISGLRYPRAAAGLGGSWALFRGLYARGYVKSGPQGRLKFSLLASLSLFSLGLMASWTSASYVLELF